MKKILIIGIVASGKTTLARRLSQKLDVPWYELDTIVHRQTPTGRYKRSVEEQKEVIQEIDLRGAWIMEGTDRASYQCLYEMADRIVFLDTPLWKRRIRIVSRFAKQLLGLEISHYKPDFRMLLMMYKWTRDFERNRASFEAKLQMYGGKAIVLRKTDEQRVDAAIRRMLEVGKRANRQQCPCCEFFTVDSMDEVIVDICEVCYWQYDAAAHNQTNRNIGANRVSLNQARENYRRFGVCKPELRAFVRTPYEEELPENN